MRLTEVNRPVPFAGTDEEKRANRASHRWWRVSEEEVLCAECDCKPWHTAANYPCGAPIPRETATVDQDDFFDMFPATVDWLGR